MEKPQGEPDVEQNIHLSWYSQQLWKLSRRAVHQPWTSLKLLKSHNSS